MKKACKSCLFDLLMVLIGFTAFVAVLFFAVFSSNSSSESIQSPEEFFGFIQSDFIIISENDTHGGFLGDGDYYFTLDCSENKEKAIEKLEQWNSLPLPENLQLIMYGGTRDGRSYGYLWAEEAGIPQITNGFYSFYDRHSEATDPYDDSELLDRHSFNFSIALYDCDTDRMYYLECDT